MTAQPPTPASSRFSALAPERFAEHVRRNSGLAPSDGEGRASACLAIVAEVSALLAAPLDEDPADVVRELPRVIGTAMAPFGWLWNGFYVLGADGQLQVGHAHGPPVCATLERRGGPLSSGMCFDGILLNQTLAAFDAKEWPGYVSCDAASGLSTVAGIVSPVRDPAGAPIAVWDLDATQPITPLDVRFVDVLFATLARTVAIGREHLVSR